MLLVGIAERIREEQAQVDVLRLGRVCLEQIEHLGREPKLRDSKRPELDFEPDHARERRPDHRGDRALSLILLNSIRDALEHTEQEGPGPHRRVGQSDVLRRQALGDFKAPLVAQRFVHQPHHGGNDLRRRVIGAGFFPSALS